MQTSHLNRLLLSAILVCLVVIICQNQRGLQMQNQSSPASFTQPSFRMVNHAPVPAAAGYAVLPLNADGSIDVRVKHVDDVIDVNIEEIDTYDKLNVHIKSTDNYALQNAGPVEVEER